MKTILVDMNIILTLLELNVILVETKIKLTNERAVDMAESGRFRRKKANFSMVSNEILRDKTISLKAKGLYSLIQSYVTLENFVLYKGFLMSHCVEGRKAFDAAWSELKETGYLIQYRMKDKENHFYYEYELLDEKSPGVPKGSNGEFSGVPFGSNTKSVAHKTCVTENGEYINNTDLSNDLLNNTTSNHIVSERDVMEQIGYDANLHDDFVKNLVLLMVDVLNTPDDSIIRVNQASQKAKVVKDRFRQIRYKHIEYVKLVFSEYTGEISSIRNYLITALFNSVTTCDIYFSQRVQHDLYGEGEQQWKAAK